MSKDLQVSHDRLAQAVVEFVDQQLRGGHGPTVLQWSNLGDALREAAQHVYVGPRGPHVSPAWLREVAGLIAAMTIHADPVKTP